MRRSGGRPHRRSSVGRLPILLAALVLAAVGLLGGVAVGRPPGRRPRRPADEVTILTGEPTELDPALQGDIGSARVGAQLFESLTAIDPSLTVRPALAESWDILDGGRRIVFHLRPGLTFSDGSPLGGRRRRPELAPDHRPEAAVAARLADGRRRRRQAYLRGQSTDPATVGLTRRTATASRSA